MVFAGDVFKYLVFPLVLLLVGAFVSGVLIPPLTRKRDDRRKALEIKTQLVSDMSEAVMEFALPMRFAVLRTVGQTKQEYENAYKVWKKRKAVLGTKLEAYFDKPGIASGFDKADIALRKPGIASGWDEVEVRVDEIYEVARDKNSGSRKRRAIELLRKYSSDAGYYQTELEQAWPLEKVWCYLEKAAIFDKKRELIGMVRGSLIYGLERPTFWHSMKSKVSAVFRRVGRWLRRKRGSSPKP